MKNKKLYTEVYPNSEAHNNVRKYLKKMEKKAWKDILKIAKENGILEIIDIGIKLGFEPKIGPPPKNKKNLDWFIDDKIFE